MKDSKGRPIRPGDLLRSDHYRDSRWGRQYLYHVACDVGQPLLEMRPAEELNTTSKVQGGRCWLTEDMAATVTIVSGGGKFPDNMFQERSK